MSFQKKPFQHVSSLSLGSVLSGKWEAGEGWAVEIALTGALPLPGVGCSQRQRELPGAVLPPASLRLGSPAFPFSWKKVVWAVVSKRCRSIFLGCFCPGFVGGVRWLNSL